ncbi:MAG TPA: hypothetical protein VFB29_17015 [Pseudolabrys sp.]|nr:hypothetical protein [Pseudolabrys sp.]
MRPRFVLIAMATITVMALLVSTAAYVSLSIFRDDIALREKPASRSAIRSVRAESPIEPDVSSLYRGAHVIVVCSELEATQKLQTRCP